MISSKTEYEAKENDQAVARFQLVCGDLSSGGSVFLSGLKENIFTEVSKFHVNSAFTLSLQSAMQ